VRARLFAAIRADSSVEVATDRDELLATTGMLVFEFLDFAHELVAIRDGAPADLRISFEAFTTCGALDGSEVVFYEVLTS